MNSEDRGLQGAVAAVRIGRLSWDPWMDPHVGLTQTFVFINMFQIHGTPKEEEISKISWKGCPVTGQQWPLSVDVPAYPVPRSLPAYT